MGGGGGGHRCGGLKQEIGRTWGEEGGGGGVKLGLHDATSWYN